MLPDTKFLPHVQAVIIGLTEGTLTMTNVSDFLQESNMDKRWIDKICESVVNFPLCAQAQLPNFSRRPVKGDLFHGKPDVWEDTNLWPDKDIALSDESEEAEAVTSAEKDDWL